MMIPNAKYQRQTRIEKERADSIENSTLPEYTYGDGSNTLNPFHIPRYEEMRYLSPEELMPI